MWTAISYIMAHWMLILGVIGVTVGLGAFAWFAKNWKAAVAALVLICAALVYQHADLSGYKRRIDEEKAQEIELLQHRLATLSFVTSLDAQRSRSDAVLIKQLKDLARDTPPNAGPCLDATSAHRVWAVRRSAVPVPAPVPAGRVSKLLPWRPGKP